MKRKRKPYEGVWNIVRFNYHFFLISLVVSLLIGSLYFILSSVYTIFLVIIVGGILLTTIMSLLISFYIYDVSDLYQMNWLKRLDFPNKKPSITNIHAGFDETSYLLAQKFPESMLSVLDFYDAEKHTEISIKRARKVYPPYPDTKIIQTKSLPFDDKSIDLIFLFLAAHEIRDSKERTQFFEELKRVCKIEGQIILIEHLRNIPNFLAYTIGFLHFLSEKTWLKNIDAAQLRLQEKFNITPFINVFVLKP